MLTRWNRIDRSPLAQNPFTLLGEIQQHFGRFLEDLDRDAGLFRPERGHFQEMSGPRVDLYDQGENLLFVMEVPGLTDKDIKLTVNAETLTIAGERQVEIPEGHSTHLRERGNIKFSRSFSFPCKVDVERVSANMQDGMLEVTVAKAPEAKPRQIQVSVG